MNTYKVIKTDLGTYHYENGVIHRFDGPAYEGIHGQKEYWVNGKKHRVDGPAVIHLDGDEEYWFNGYLHRLDSPQSTGPAICRYSTCQHEYWIDGQCIIKQENGIAAEEWSGWVRSNGLSQVNHTVRLIQPRNKFKSLYPCRSAGNPRVTHPRGDEETAT